MPTKDEENKRPEWTHPISEKDFRWILEVYVTEIQHKWRFTGEDTSEHWIELKGKRGDKQVTKKFPATRGLGLRGLAEFNPDHARLIRLTYSGERASRDIDKIDAWEKKNKRDRSEYERLRAKFETTSGERS